MDSHHNYEKVQAATEGLAIYPMSYTEAYGLTLKGRHDFFLNRDKKKKRSKENKFLKKNKISRYPPYRRIA